LKGGKIPIEILVRGKDAEENKKQFEKCLDIIKKAGKKVAVLKKDNASGGFADEWKAAFGDAGFKDEDQIELGPILSQAAMSIKDAKELVRLRDTPFRSTVADKLSATHPRCVASIERRHEQLLRRGNVRDPRLRKEGIPQGLLR
jgi:nucleosome binding factor SPN SPT16 subunit